MTPLLRLLFALAVGIAIVLFVIALAVPSPRLRDWSYGCLLFAAAILVVSLYAETLS